MSKPYEMARQVKAVQMGNGWRIEMELADTPNVSAQKEHLLLVTHVSGQFPDHPQALHLAALLRVRDLLTAQIEAT